MGPLCLWQCFSFFLIFFSFSGSTEQQRSCRWIVQAREQTVCTEEHIGGQNEQGIALTRYSICLCWGVWNFCENWEESWAEQKGNFELHQEAGQASGELIKNFLKPGFIFLSGSWLRCVRNKGIWTARKCWLNASWLRCRIFLKNCISVHLHQAGINFGSARAMERACSR